MNQLKTFIIFATVFLFSAIAMPSFAAISKHYQPPQQFNNNTSDFTPGFYVQVVGGVGLSDVGKTQTFTLNPPGTLAPPDLYWHKSKRVFEPVAGISVGNGFALHNNLFLQAGLGIYRTGEYSGSGIIYQEGDYNRHNLAYNYKVHSTRLMVEGKLIYSKGNKFLPYFALGVGVASNKAKDYNEVSLNIVTPATTFSDRTTEKFAYQAGMGVMYNVCKGTNILVGYQFADVGKGEFGKSPVQKSSARFNTGDILIHSLLIGVNYVFM